MEDSIARDGVLARCDQDQAAAQHDIECANARRAATAVLLNEERARRRELERESERKLEALRQQMALEQQAAREAELADAAAAQAAYEAQWAELNGAGTAPGAAPAPSGSSVQEAGLGASSIEAAPNPVVAPTG